MKYAKTIVAEAVKHLGIKEGSDGHKEILNVYNTHKPLARSYKVKETDSWCATFISYLSIKCDYTSIIPTECSCEKMIEKLKKINSFEENENRKPNVGDIIFYDWQDTGVGDNKGFSDHVGIVEKVVGNDITVIEGNYSDMVKRRVIEVNAKGIRGYGIPKYDKEPVTATVKPTATTTVKPVYVPKAYTGYFPTLPTRGYYKLGDGYKTLVTVTTKTNIKYIQKFLNWYLGTKLTVDGEYGEKTTSAVKTFQSKCKLTQDGKYGRNTLAKAKSVKK